MVNFLKQLFLWLKSVYSESSGNGSATRVHIGLIVGFVIAVGLSFATAVHLHKLTIDQFNSYLNTAGQFVVVTGGPLYAANQAGNWLQKREDNKNQNQQ